MADSPDPASSPHFHGSDPDSTEFSRTRNCGLVDEDSDDVDEAASAICFTGPWLIRRGLANAGLLETTVVFVNVGGGAQKEQGNSSVHLQPDSFFLGGDVIRTDETVIEGGDMPFLYQSARFGNCCYQFDTLTPGDYTVDLHFAEIINTNGPKGMMVFDVLVQEEKVLCEFDIYAEVGAHRPLQLVDVRVSVAENGSITIRFEGVYGSPIVSGICIKPATQLLVRYEKKIEELTTQCQLKTDECYEAWMALTAANEELEKVKMELDKKCIQSYNQDQAMAKQAAELQHISSRYKHDKRQWTLIFEEIWKKVKTMQQEHSQLSREAHECADSVPELDKMLHAVQALVARCQHLTLKYNEELAKRKQLHNQEKSESSHDMEGKFSTRPASVTKVQQEWSCAVCLVNMTSSKCMTSHLEGKKHKAKKEKPVRLCKWTKPQLRWTKLNTDGSTGKKNRGFGGLLRDHGGNPICAFVLKSTLGAVFLLEMWAIWRGLVLALGLGIKVIWIESDSLYGVKTIKRDKPYGTNAESCLYHIWELLKKFDKYKVSHSWRQTNRAGDFLSKMVLNGKDVVLWPVDFPESLHNIIKEDAEGKIYYRG